MTRKKHINKFLAPTQSRDNPANLFMFMCFSFFWEDSWHRSLEPPPPPQKEPPPPRPKTLSGHCLSGSYRLSKRHCRQIKITFGLICILLQIQMQTKYCPRRNHYWINSGKGGSNNLKDCFAGIICPSRRVKPENYWKRLIIVIHSRQSLSRNKNQ